MIYFIQQGSDGPIKIGISYDPKKRLAQLQSGSPQTLKLLHSEAGEATRETAIHRTFDRYRLRGEWFSPGSKLMAFINYLRNRGNGHDMEGEVLEPGDSVGFEHGDQWLNGVVKTAPKDDYDKVLVITNDGRSLMMQCNALLVYTKTIPEFYWSLDG